ncbi:hypothetical protein FK498_16275 [Elioraea sp. Yellowstone]|jgi:hypothetical protein|uniref:hypothetical protein n=1 Tax=Elioraea sp. Yellowstone TaxID=2592070 RepID=UPI0011535735|nr:hypothetical protein [Elioraea sp. Yellowstone]TQF76724.1 hypothetical protein FK498_16275 [Elioraea sp. Yellowstone]
MDAPDNPLPMRDRLTCHRRLKLRIRQGDRRAAAKQIAVVIQKRMMRIARYQGCCPAGGRAASLPLS